ncbi:MAG TPA: L-fucose/L-arabinose isomerase family protein [Anaerolineae bacterium]|nr:L-fucose/L-arabinose isomerase family protein [Anaerolineae bacterium]
MSKTTLGVIVGNRGFFPDHLCETGRVEILRVLEEEGIDAIALSPEDTPYGSVETWEDAKKCAALFKQHAEEIDGVLVTLPNFGDERAVADTIRLSGLDVPVLVHAFPDEIDKMLVTERRDSFCGKMSVCNNLSQYGIPYSLTTLHTVSPDSESFRSDLQQFAAVCRVAGGLQGIKVGVLGARPAAFITVRYSEKLLEKAGISVVSLDLSEAFGQAEKLSDDDPEVVQKLEDIRNYTNTREVPEQALKKMARFGLVMDRWVEANDLVATAVQCWTSIEEYFGIVPCAVMSMLSNSLLPSACETDVTGAIGMYAMRLASGRPSALLDWNNNYGDDPNKCVFFHCSNLPKDVFADVKMTYQEIISHSVGKDSAYGTMDGRIKAAPFTYLRVSTDDEFGAIRAYVGEGELTDDPLVTFGGYGVVEIPEFQALLRFICENGFEHHVAMNLSQCATAVDEALSKYLGWDVYYHAPNGA